MQSEVDTGAAVRSFRHPLWLLVGGYWVWLVAACAKDWTEIADYNHGWFVPFFALYFLWKRIEDAGPEEAGEGTTGVGQWLAWGIVGGSLLFIIPIELARQAPLYWRLYPWIIGLLAVGNTWAVAWLTGRRHVLGLVMFPALFMMAGIPWPTMLESAVSLPLMGWVTRLSVGLLHLAGYAAVASGNTITLPQCTVGVEEACSGLRSLQAALLVGLAAGELMRFGAWGRIVLLGGSLMMALVANQVRVMFLALVGISGGSKAVLGLHDAAGYAVLGVLLGGVVLLSWGMGLLRKSLGDPGEVK